jgi:hypothetical protein
MHNTFCEEDFSDKLEKKFIVYERSNDYHYYRYKELLKKDEKKFNVRHYLNYTKNLIEKNLTLKNYQGAFHQAQCLYRTLFWGSEKSTENKWINTHKKASDKDVNYYNELISVIAKSFYSFYACMVKEDNEYLDPEKDEDDHYFYWWVEEVEEGSNTIKWDKTLIDRFYTNITKSVEKLKAEENLVESHQKLLNQHQKNVKKLLFLHLNKICELPLDNMDISNTREKYYKQEFSDILLKGDNNNVKCHNLVINNDDMKTYSSSSNNNNNYYHYQHESEKKTIFFDHNGYFYCKEYTAGDGHCFAHALTQNNNYFIKDSHRLSFEKTLQEIYINENNTSKTQEEIKETINKIFDDSKLEFIKNIYSCARKNKQYIKKFETFEKEFPILFNKTCDENYFYKENYFLKLYRFFFDIHMTSYNTIWQHAPHTFKCSESYKDWIISEILSRFMCIVSGKSLNTFVSRNGCDCSFYIHNIDNIKENFFENVRWIENNAEGNHFSMLFPLEITDIRPFN